MDIKRKAFETSNNVNPDWSFKFDEELQQYVATDFEMTNQVDEFNEHWDTFRAGWDAKAQAVLEIQQSQQAEIDDLKAQLKAVHDSRIEFVEYCRKMESGDFVIVDKTDLELAIDALKDASNNDDDSFAHRAKDLEKALKNFSTLWLKAICHLSKSSRIASMAGPRNRSR